MTLLVDKKTASNKKKRDYKMRENMISTMTMVWMSLSVRQKTVLNCHLIEWKSTSKPDVSYWCRLSGSDKILYENVTSLKASAAIGSFAFLSGWYLQNEQKQMIRQIMDNLLALTIPIPSRIKFNHDMLENYSNLISWLLQVNRQFSLPQLWSCHIASETSYIMMLILFASIVMQL